MSARRNTNPRNLEDPDEVDEVLPSEDDPERTHSGSEEEPVIIRDTEEEQGRRRAKGKQKMTKAELMEEVKRLRALQGRDAPEPPVPARAAPVRAAEARGSRPAAEGGSGRAAPKFWWEDPDYQDAFNGFARKYNVKYRGLTANKYTTW